MEKFSLYKRAKSFVHASRGLALFIKTTQNAWVELLILLGVIIFGVYFDITNLEWALIMLSAGLVLSAEAFNTAIEIDMDLTSPEEHPRAKDTKDVAAGAVLIASVFAAVVGVLIFWPYLK
ncbi:MAG: diacylglycerol kinase family protein [Minisyncoccia bacterium]